MQMKILALWPLLLIQMPTAFMSDMSFSDGDFGSLVKRPREKITYDPPPNPKRIADSSLEQPAERVQAQPKWVSPTTPQKEKDDRFCKKVEETLRNWGLSLPIRKELNPKKPRCGLPLNPRTTVDADADAIAKRVFHGSYCDSDLIRKSKKNNFLILPSEDGIGAPSKFSAKGTRYVLRGGIGKIKRSCLDHPVYIDFTANTNGIVVDSFKDALFVTRPTRNLNYEAIGNKRFLLNRITSIEDDLEFSLKYLFYEDVGSLEAPYPIPHLGLNDDFLDSKEVEQILGLGTRFWDVVYDGMSLIRLVQLWRELKPEYKDHRLEEFENSVLRSLNGQLETLRDDAAKNKKEDLKTLILTASKFILQRNPFGNKVGEIDERKFIRDKYPFLRVLMEKESKVRESFAIELDDHLRPKETVDKDVCNDLVGKLAFYREGNLQIEKVPYEIVIPCQEQLFTFRLIARITDETLFTYGTDDDSDEGGKIITVARYDDESIDITCLPFEDTTNVSFEVEGGLLIYQYVEDK